MRTIKALKRTEKRFNGDSQYNIYFYTTIDEYGNTMEVGSFREYKIGQRVEVWFNSEYNQPRMRPYKEKR